MNQDRTRPAFGSHRTRTINSIPAPRPQEDEFLRRARAVDAAKQLSANGLRMAQRVQSRALSDALQKLAFAALPHIDNELTAPLAQLQVHTPFGELVLSMDLPKQLVDALIKTVLATAELVAEAAPGHSRTADTAPAPARALKAIPGGAGR